jgi:hypothetical protein
MPELGRDQRNSLQLAKPLTQRAIRKTCLALWDPGGTPRLRCSSWLSQIGNLLGTFGVGDGFRTRDFLSHSQALYP